MNFDRKTTEKMWDVLKEIKDRLVLGENNISIPLLGSWVKIKFDKGLNGKALQEELNKRILICRYLKQEGKISNLKTPSISNLDGDIKFRADEKKISQYFRSIERTRKAQVKAFLNKTNSDTKSVKLGTSYRKGDTLFLKIDGVNKPIEIGNIKNRPSKLVELLCIAPEAQRTVDSTFDAIKITKDSQGKDYSEKETIIKDAMREVQRILKSNGLSRRFKFKAKNRRVWVETP